MHLRLTPAGNPPPTAARRSVSCRQLARATFDRPRKAAPARHQHPRHPAMRLLTPQPAPPFQPPSPSTWGPAGRSSLVFCLRRIVYGIQNTRCSHLSHSRQNRNTKPGPSQFLLRRTDDLCQLRAHRLTISAAPRQMRCPNLVTLGPNILHPGSASSSPSHQWVMAQRCAEQVTVQSMLFLADDGLPLRRSE